MVLGEGYHQNRWVLSTHTHGQIAGSLLGEEGTWGGGGGSSRSPEVSGSLRLRSGLLSCLQVKTEWTALLGQWASYSPPRLTIPGTVLTPFPQTSSFCGMRARFRGQGRSCEVLLLSFCCRCCFVSVTIITIVAVVIIISRYYYYFAICCPRGGVLCRPRAAHNRGLQIAPPVLGRVRIFELALGFGMILGPRSLIPIGSRSGIIMITSPRLLALLSVYWWLKIYYLFISRLFFFFPFLPITFLKKKKK